MVLIEVAFSWQSRQMVILFSHELTTSDCVFQLYYESSRRSKFYLQIYIKIYKNKIYFKIYYSKTKVFHNLCG